VDAGGKRHEERDGDYEDPDLIVERRRQLEPEPQEVEFARHARPPARTAGGGH